MNKTIDSDSIYKAVVEVLTNNYTANLFSSLQRENLAKKVSHKVGNLLDINVDQEVATHMGDQIIKDENNTEDGLTEAKHKEIEKSKKAKAKKTSRKINKNISKKQPLTDKSKKEVTGGGLKNLK